MKKAILTLTVLALIGCKKDEPAPKIGPVCAEKPRSTIPLDITLINGEPVDPKDMPASVYASSGSSSCSSTVVGEKTLLSAAHCMNNGGTVSFKLGGKTYKGSCTHHPDYKRNQTADWALCELDKPVTGIKFESLLIDAFKIHKGEKVMLSGFGCVRPGGGGGNDGVLRRGTAEVTRLPSGTNYDVVTVGGAALCYGDSGGAAYFVQTESGYRWIFGVNSRGDIRETSYLPAVFSENFKTWAKKWESDRAQKICGLNPEAKDCRDTTCQPQPIMEIGKNHVIKKGEYAILGGEAVPGQEYEWTPTYGLDNPKAAQVRANPCETTTYKLKVRNKCGVIEKSVTVSVEN